MSGSAGGGHRRRTAAIAAAAAFVAGALVAAVPARVRGPEPPPAPTGVLTYDAGGYRYTYHVLTGAESLFDECNDPRELHDLSPADAALTRQLRRALESKLRVENLDTLRDEHEETIRRLRSLGYL